MENFNLFERYFLIKTAIETLTSPITQWKLPKDFVMLLGHCIILFLLFFCFMTQLSDNGYRHIPAFKSHDLTSDEKRLFKVQVKHVILYKSNVAHTAVINCRSRKNIIYMMLEAS